MCTLTIGLTLQIDSQYYTTQRLQRQQEIKILDSRGTKALFH
jgi:hypothetical protein